MKFELKKPCANCPFRRSSLLGWLGRDRAKEIGFAVSELQQTFSCHKTNDFDEESGDGVEGERTQHCAGALIVLEKMEKPNQMMRIAERLGLYDRFKLDMESDVFDDLEEFVDHHS